MPVNNRAALAKIHIARKQLGLDEAAYRGLLMRVTGRDSAARLNGKTLGLVLDEMKRLGWNTRKAPRSPRPQVRKIFALWKSLAPHLEKHGSRESLRAFVQRLTGVSDPNFLEGNDANKVIEALKEWKQRYD